MKFEKLIMIFVVCICLVVSPVMSYETKMISITPGGTQYISVPESANITYIYTSVVPDNGKMMLSTPSNDTYMISNGDSIEMITVNKKQSSSNIIDIILGWFS